MCGPVLRRRAPLEEYAGRWTCTFVHGPDNSPADSAVSPSVIGVIFRTLAPQGRFAEIQVSIRSHQSYSQWTRSS